MNDLYVIRPAPGRILIEIDESHGELPGKIIVPDPEWIPPKERAATGIVSQVCSSYELEGQDYEPLYPVGTLVLFGKFTGTRVEQGDQVFILMRENDVMATIIQSEEGVDLQRIRVNDKR